MERHEVLKSLGGKLDELKKLPEGTKGIKTIIPNTIFPFVPDVNVYIERSTSRIILPS
jgi:hypothetical protein